MKIRDSPDKGYPAPVSASTPVSRFFFQKQTHLLDLVRRPNSPAGFFFENKNNYKCGNSYLPITISARLVFSPLVMKADRVLF